MATVTFSAAGETLYAYLAGEIDHDAAQSLRMQLDDALVSRSPRTLIIDLGGVGFMDSSGIGLILGRQRSPASWARPCGCSTPPHSCKKSCGWRASPVRRTQKRRMRNESREQHPHPVRFP